MYGASWVSHFIIIFWTSRILQKCIKNTHLSSNEPTSWVTELTLDAGSKFILSRSQKPLSPDVSLLLGLTYTIICSMDAIKTKFKLILTARQMQWEVFTPHYIIINASGLFVFCRRARGWRGGRLQTSQLPRPHPQSQNKNSQDDTRHCFWWVIQTHNDSRLASIALIDANSACYIIFLSHTVCAWWTPTAKIATTPLWIRRKKSTTARPQSEKIWMRRVFFYFLRARTFFIATPKKQISTPGVLWKIQLSSL